MAAVQPSRRDALALFLALALTLYMASGLAWADAPTERPSLPTFSGDKAPLQAPKKMAPRPVLPDTRALFDLVMACYPEPSYFRGEIALEGRARNHRAATLQDDGTLSGGGRVQLALVAKLPLYSAVELDREREREYTRRGKVADSVGAFVREVAKRHKLGRELDLARALESRAQERVAVGVAETAEQVRYMERVADIEAGLIESRGVLEKARLEMLGHCATHRTQAVDDTLSEWLQ